MHNSLLLDHFANPRNVGELPSPAIVVEVSNPACGDILRLSVRFQEDCVAEVRFKTRGCAASIAAGSLLTSMLLHRTRDGLADFTASELETALGGLPAESRHAAVLCSDAVRAIVRAASLK